MNTLAKVGIGAVVVYAGYRFVVKPWMEKNKAQDEPMLPEYSRAQQIEVKPTGDIVIKKPVAKPIGKAISRPKPKPRGVGMTRPTVFRPPTVQAQFESVQPPPQQTGPPSQWASVQPTISRNTGMTVSQLNDCYNG